VEHNKPYLGLTLELDLRAITRLMLDSSLPSPRTNHDRLGIAVSLVSLPLLDAFQRLIDLLEQAGRHAGSCSPHPTGNLLPAACK
jgi:hypothetical protein